MTPVNSTTTSENSAEKRLAEQVERLEKKRLEFVQVMGEATASILREKKLETLELCKILDDITNLNGTNLKLKFDRYLSLNEKNYLKAKDLSAYTRVNSKYEMAIARTKQEKYGTSDWFDASLTAIDGGFCFHLPPIPGKKVTDRNAKDGEYIRLLIARLISDYDKEHFGEIHIMDSPVAIFVHHIDYENALQQTLDADNLDEKVATDALGAYLISDDNLLSLWTMHFGIEDKNSFCDFFIIEKSGLINWLENNKELLGMTV